MANNILLTGRPGVGKTTLVKRIIGRCSTFALTGFYTEEIRQGRRVGFRAVTLSGSSAVFAHRDFHGDSRYRVGPYTVKPQILEDLVLAHIDPERKRADLVVIDEIARMELCSKSLREQFLQALNSDCPVLATVAWKGTGLIKHVKERTDVELFTITERNRDVLQEAILRSLRRMLGRSRA